MSDDAEREAVLSVEQIAGDRWQVLDAEGRYMESFASYPEARAFSLGYAHGRRDAARIVRHAIRKLDSAIEVERPEEEL